MFHEVLGGLESSKRQLSEKVRDSFGESICSEVFDKMISTIHQMNAANDAAKLRETEIKVLTAELRLLL